MPTFVHAMSVVFIVIYLVGGGTLLLLRKLIQKGKKMSPKSFDFIIIH